MSAAEVLADATAAGLQIKARGESLVISGDPGVRAAWRETLSKFKPDLLAALSARPPAEGEPAACWALIEGEKFTEITIWPPATRAEVERLHPGVVVHLDDRRQPDPEPNLLDQAAAWALLLGERDVALVMPFAEKQEYVEWLRDRALDALRRDGPRLVADLSDAEAAKAAMVAVDAPVPEPVARVLATMRPALFGQYAADHIRARTARHVLHLVATT